jgi:PAS domain S-box-containing protein
VTGFSQQDVLGKTVFDFAPEDLAVAFSDHDSAIVEARETIVWESMMRRADGRIRNCNATKFPIFDADGEVVAVGGISFDITDEKKAAEALRQSEERVRLIADTLPASISYFDSDYRFQFFNETYARLYGRRAEEFIGEKVEEVIGAARFEQFRPNMERALAGENWTLKLKVDYLGGTPRDMEFIYVPHLGADGSVLGVYAMGTDVTERNLAEEQLRQAQKMEAVGQLTGGLAHDFNNLLAVILGNADPAKEQLREDDPLNAYLDASTRAALRGAELTQRLLAFSRKQTLRPRTLDLDTLVGGMMDFLRRTLEEAIEIETKHEAGLWPVVADPGQLENVILNLAINARDAMPDGGVLAIEVANADIGDEFAITNPDLEPGPYVVLSIRDTGTGMPDEIIERAFDPFFTTKEVGAGSGLGFSMVYGFIKQSGGHVDIESAVGRGTTVRLYLPKAREGEAAAACAADEVGQVRGHGETVLVVEDDEAVRELTMNIVNSLGYTALGASDGVTGLEALEEHAEVSLLLTDFVLPGGSNGLELAERARERRPGIKVLFMSGYTQTAGDWAGRSIEDTDLVRKPFRKSELAAKLRAALRG